MVNLRHKNRANGSQDGRHGREDGGQGGDRGLADELREIVAHLHEIAEAQHRQKHLYTVTQTASLVVPGQIFRHLHLPEEAAIQSAYVENNSTISHLTIYEGPGASGRIIGFVAPGKTKRLAIADYISSLSIVSDQTDLSGALVIVTITSHKWSPTSGTI